MIEVSPERDDRQDIGSDKFCFARYVLPTLEAFLFIAWAVWLTVFHSA
jgi:hypothetical protein